MVDGVGVSSLVQVLVHDSHLVLHGGGEEERRLHRVGLKDIEMASRTHARTPAVKGKI